MQGGSGSPDILAGGTFQVQNEVASVGAQINSVIRVVDNKRGYRLGDEFDFTVWGAYNVTDWVSFSIRGVFENQSEVKGSDFTHGRIGRPSCEPVRSGRGTRLHPDSE